MNPLAEAIAGTPFRMPLAVGRGTARAERPLSLNPRAGATLATTLRGAYETALLEAGCVRQAGRRCFEQQPLDEAEPCREPGRCPVPYLYKPRSRAQRRDHAPPIGLWVRQEGPRELTVTLVLWGRRAVAARRLACEALMRAGRVGLWDGSEAVAFDASVEPLFEGMLGEWVRREGDAASGPTHLRVELASPYNGKRPDLAHMLGNLAHDLVQWDLEDGGESTVLGKRGCDALADAARVHARDSLAGVVVRRRELECCDQGPRYSRGNGGVFRLRGVRGLFDLSGDLSAAWPWLPALVPAGGRRQALLRPGRGAPVPAGGVSGPPAARQLSAAGRAASETRPPRTCPACLRLRRGREPPGRLPRRLFACRSCRETSGRRRLGVPRERTLKSRPPGG